MQVAFAKYEGAGNDFILIDNREGRFQPNGRLIAALCDRHFGIGADGLMTLQGNAALDCSMRYYNADGSEGEMCGNGARCFMLFAEHLGVGGKTKHFDAMDGVHRAHIRHTQGFRGEIEVGMIDVRQIDRNGNGWSLNTGVPHYVEMVEALDRVDVVALGHAIRHDTARFPQGANVDFVEVIGDATLRIRTYERGVENETLACGTGATAAAIVANHLFRDATDRYRIETSGGLLEVRFKHEPERTVYTDIRLSGPARRVFDGSFETANF